MLWGGRLRSRRKLALQLSDSSRASVSFGPSPQGLLPELLHLSQSLSGEVPDVSLMLIALALNHLPGLMNNANGVLPRGALSLLNGRRRGTLRLLDPCISLFPNGGDVPPSFVDDVRIHAGVHDV